MSGTTFVQNASTALVTGAEALSSTKREFALTSCRGDTLSSSHEARESLWSEEPKLPAPQAEDADGKSLADYLLVAFTCLIKTNALSTQREMDQLAKTQQLDVTMSYAIAGRARENLERCEKVMQTLNELDKTQHEQEEVAKVSSVLMYLGLGLTLAMACGPAAIELFAPAEAAVAATTTTAAEASAASAGIALREIPLAAGADPAAALAPGAGGAGGGAAAAEGAAVQAASSVQAEIGAAGAAARGSAVAARAPASARLAADVERENLQATRAIARGISRTSSATWEGRANAIIGLFASATSAGPTGYQGYLKIKIHNILENLATYQEETSVEKAANEVNSSYLAFWQSASDRSLGDFTTQAEQQTTILQSVEKTLRSISQTTEGLSQKRA